MTHAQEKGLHMILQKEANFDLDRLLGYSETSTTISERTDPMASLSRLSPTRAILWMGGVIGLGTLAAVETGLSSPLVAALALAAVIYLIGAMSPLTHRRSTTETTRQGMADTEAWEYVVLHDEHEALKADQREKSAKKQRAKMGPSGANPGGSARNSRSRRVS